MPLAVVESRTIGMVGQVVEKAGYIWCETGGRAVQVVAGSDELSVSSPKIGVNQLRQSSLFQPAPNAVSYPAWNQQSHNLPAPFPAPACAMY